MFDLRENTMNEWMNELFTFKSKNIANLFDVDRANKSHIYDGHIKD